MIVSDKQVLEAQSAFWNELACWRILPLARGQYKALRDRGPMSLAASTLSSTDQIRYMDQDSEDAARGYIQFQALKAAIQVIQLTECPPQ